MEEMEAGGLLKEARTSSMSIKESLSSRLMKRSGERRRRRRKGSKRIGARRRESSGS
jgi:hypothetical protein